MLQKNCGNLVAIIDITVSNNKKVLESNLNYVASSDKNANIIE